MDVSQFYQAFFEEANELLAEMELLLLGLDLQAPESEHLNAIFRAAHSIKGGAATFGFSALTDTTHLLENLLDRARHGELQLNPDVMGVFLQTKDVLQRELSAYQDGTEPETAMVDQACSALRQLSIDAESTEPAGAANTPAPPSADTPVPSLPEATPVKSTIRSLKVTFSQISDNDSRLLSEELRNLGTVRDEQRGTDTLRVLLETACDSDDIVAVCCFVIDPDQIDIQTASAEAAPANHECPVPAPIEPAGALLAPNPSSGTATPAASRPVTPAQGTGKEAGTIRVDVAKVDQIINLVGELVITQSMLIQASSALDPVLHERLLNCVDHLERNALALQESVMSIRMMPIDYVFSRFPRLIHDLSAKLGKQVRLETMGQETELDKGLIERVIDPITHLVRNSLDHGIEAPAQRMAAGKLPVGCLTLSAQHQGGNIVIEVTDDGGGLPRDKILAKALAQGLPVSDSMADEELWPLIFAPGFSTAETVSDVSGRGVGMDVVKRNIQEMGGHIDIRSKPGLGTTIRIFLPLTLAILNGMSVKVGREIYILPLNYVIESLQPAVVNIHSIAGNERVLHVRGDYLSLVELHRIFEVENAISDPAQGIAVIVQSDGTRFALLVDQLVGQHQVVVKNLETNYRKVAGISAATILGDGNVAFIIDVASLRHNAVGSPGQ